MTQIQGYTWTVVGFTALRVGTKQKDLGGGVEEMTNQETQLPEDLLHRTDAKYYEAVTTYC